jgi:uncharacterized protein (TIGR02594 family)
MTPTAPAGAPAMPVWFASALKEVGVRELPENRGPDIRRYIAMAHCGAEGEPWCAIFQNAMLESNGIRGTRSPSSQSFRHDPNFVQLSGPALGAIVVYWRTSKASGLGHVGMYNGEHAGLISTLGGNEGDMVKIEDLNPSARNFGLVGYYWPKSVPLPLIGKLPVQSASHAGSGKVT